MNFFNLDDESCGPRQLHSKKKKKNQKTKNYILKLKQKDKFPMIKTD
jgi:hypothetical protein